MWRERAPELYDLLSITSLEAPAVCTEWFPWRATAGGRCVRALLLGTDAEGEVTARLGGSWEPPSAAVRETRDFLCVARVDVPEDEPSVAEAPADAQANAPKVEVTKRVSHAGPVCCLAICPQNPDLAATGTVIGEALVFNLTAHPAVPPSDGRCRPDSRLACHEEACFGVAWSPHQEGLLVTGGLDGRLCLWDLKKAGRTGDLQANPLRFVDKAQGGKAVVSTAFHPGSCFLVASAGEDGQLCLWDLRMPWNNGVAEATASVAAHAGGCNAFAFAPYAPGLVATGGQDALVRLWDLRRLGSSLGFGGAPAETVALGCFAGHKAAVQRLAWAPHAPLSAGPGCCLASAGHDGRVLLWEPGTGAPGIQEVEAAAGAPCFAPELVFAHAAHGTAATGLAWAPPAEDGKSPLLASADGAGALHLWRPAAAVLREDSCQRCSGQY